MSIVSPLGRKRGHWSTLQGSSHVGIGSCHGLSVLQRSMAAVEGSHGESGAVVCYSKMGHWLTAGHIFLFWLSAVCAGRSLYWVGRGTRAAPPSVFSTQNDGGYLFYI